MKTESDFWRDRSSFFLQSLGTKQADLKSTNDSSKKKPSKKKPDKSLADKKRSEALERLVSSHKTFTEAGGVMLLLIFLTTKEP